MPEAMVEGELITQEEASAPGWIEAIRRRATSSTTTTSKPAGARIGALRTGAATRRAHPVSAYVVASGTTSSGTAVIDSSKQRPAGQRATESRPLSSRRQPGLSYSAALTGGTQADSSISGRVGEPPVTDNNPVQPPGATAPDTSVLVLTALASALRSLLELAPADSPARHIMASTPREQRPRIVQWNVRSMRCRHPELAGGALIDGCDVLALQETYVRAGELNLPGFVAYHSATSCQQASCTASPCVDPSHPAGRSRASLYVRAGLAQAEVNVCDLPCANVECVAVTVRVGATDTCVASVYVRSCAACLTVLGGDLVVCGDFNSHHTAWGSNHIDCSGRGLLDSVLRAGLLIANTGAVTFVRSGCAGSAIDLTLVSDRCHYAWRRNPDTGGSDHFPIFLVPRATADLPTRSYSVVNWPRFRELCAAVSVSECGLFRHIAECARAATTRCVVPAGTPVPDIKQLNLRAARRRAQRKAVRTDKREHWTVYNRLDAVCRRHARQRRSASWSSLCCSLDDPRARSRPWRILGAVLRPRVPRCPALSIAVARGITNAQLAELLAATFCPPTAASTRPTGILQPHHHPRRELMAPQRYFPAAGTLEEISALCTADFTIGELRTVLASRRRRSAPGSDGVTYQMLRNFDSDQLHHLLDAYNAVWRSGVIPREWSEAVVVPLLKNGKPPRDPASYRPVSLTSAAGKVLEAMALRRLEWIAAVLDILAAEQSGFRRLRASADSLADVVTTLEEAKHRGDASYLVLLDVMSAFDQLPHATILDALCAMGVSGRLLAYVGAFLSGRTMRVRVGGALTPSQPTKHLPTTTKSPTATPTWADRVAGKGETRGSARTGNLPQHEKDEIQELKRELAFLRKENAEFKALIRNLQQPRESVVEAPTPVAPAVEPAPTTSSNANRSAKRRAAEDPADEPVTMSNFMEALARLRADIAADRAADMTPHTLQLTELHARLQILEGQHAAVATLQKDSKKTLFGLSYSPRRLDTELASTKDAKSLASEFVALVKNMSSNIGLSAIGVMGLRESPREMIHSNKIVAGSRCQSKVPGSWGFQNAMTR
ncbi:hypothetical protein HPB49_004060 [Dermacentor silvarum]|uniref:Uncharacterized protein n=1 Tax=Dermacentor silvarum TaxID=543639 RepID=A0ACB8DME0_DERSI|nr:hypothetical protein HPB49_004060 [Dermacentor silvarum]